MENIFLVWYEAIEPGVRIYWTIAGVASLVFIVQMILTFVGIGDADAGADISADVDGDTLGTGGVMQLFSIRNVVNFLLGFGWGGVCWSSVVDNPVVLLVLALLTGVVFVGLFVLLLKQVMKLETNGAYRVEECVGTVCDVYLRIPAARTGQGKVQVSFGGSIQELAAVTDGELLPSGTKVKVLSLVDKHTLLVEKA